jgi:hypothetical protein
LWESVSWIVCNCIRFATIGCCGNQVVKEKQSECEKCDKLLLTGSKELMIKASSISLAEKDDDGEEEDEDEEEEKEEEEEEEGQM